MRIELHLRNRNELIFMKKLGLVGGISWISTVDYYRFINEEVNRNLNGLNFAECIIYSLNFAEVQEIGWDNSFPILHRACMALKRSGADAIVLCANTAHFAIEELERTVGLPFIHIVSATTKEVKNMKLTKVGLLGTKFTMEMDFYTKKLRANGIETLVPSEVTDRNFIQQTLRDELGLGILKNETKLAYMTIINGLIERGAEGIILGCTELPLIINQNDVSVPIFDTTKIHATASVKFALS